jgi:hypothetical protein
MSNTYVKQSVSGELAHRLIDAAERTQPNWDILLRSRSSTRVAY